MVVNLNELVEEHRKIDEQAALDLEKETDKKIKDRGLTLLDLETGGEMTILWNNHVRRDVAQIVLDKYREKNSKYMISISPHPTKNGIYEGLVIKKKGEGGGGIMVL